VSAMQSRSSSYHGISFALATFHDLVLDHDDLVTEIFMLWGGADIVLIGIGLRIVLPTDSHRVVLTC
jgi:hypothetical protein